MTRDWHQLIPDCPTDWALIPLDGHKRPIDPASGELLKEWQHQDGHDIDSLAQLNGLVKAAGLLLGPKSSGTLAVDFDGPDAAAKFQEVFGRSPAELPSTIAVTSGKPSRCQRLFTVDQDWWEHLRGRKAWKNDSGSTCLELRWSGCQSVIAGDHPETDGYRWMPGASPAEQCQAAAPEWLLEPLIRTERDLEPVPITAEDAKRAVAMLQHIEALERTGYDEWLEVGMALHHTDPGLLSEWVEWSRSMPNFDEQECLAKWESFGNSKGSLTIRSLHHWAKQGGYREPKRSVASNSEDQSSSDLLSGAQELKRRLDEGLERIDSIKDVATRSAGLHKLRSELGLNEKAFTGLVKALSEAKAPTASESFDELMASDEQNLTPLAEDLLPAGLVLIAAEGGAGKSNTAYQVAEAVTNGSKFAGQFQCQQGAALIIQKDESPTDAKRKFLRMALKPAKGALHIKWKFSSLMFPELRRWVAEYGAKLVVLDSLMTIAGGEISPKDAEFGLLIYRLNQLAGELGITILCLHHVIKGGKQRQEIAKDDIFGTAYVYNGASDAWGLWRSREDGTGDELFNLRCLKSRSGLVDVGTTYQFTGNDEDRRMMFKGWLIEQSPSTRSTAHVSGSAYS